MQVSSHLPRVLQKRRYQELTPSSPENFRFKQAVKYGEALAKTLGDLLSDATLDEPLPTKRC